MFSITTNGIIASNHEPASETNNADVTDHTDINTCATVEDITLSLRHLNDQESQVTERLQALLSTQQELSHSLSRLDLLRAHLGTQVVVARSLSNNTLSGAAATANRVSSAVKRLDTEQSRVKATLEVVEQVSELKACVLGVTGSMGAPQDWETAASYLHRASKIPPEIINGEFAEEMVPSAEVPDLPAVTLENAAEALCGLFLREFEKATANADGEKVTRFFKLFPLIGRAQVGLDVYGRYVCGGVASRARAQLSAPKSADAGPGDFFYANAMTRLFEHIATIVEQHGALVDRHYGVGRMVKVIERLQLEADTQGGIIIDTFMDDRGIDRKLTDIRSYAFSFLVQSFLPGPRGNTRSASPAPGATGNRNSEEEDSIDVKEIDMLLTEIGVMLSRWSLYCRFLARKCQNQVESSPETPLSVPMTPKTPTAPSKPTSLTLPDVLLNSNLAQKVQDRLITPFHSMATFFCRRSVEKAFQLDEAPTDLSLNLSVPPSTASNPPYITSAVDDVMYVLNKQLQRVLETSQRSLVSNVISAVGRILGGDFVGMIQRKMRDESYPRAASNIPGAAPSEDKILAFLVLINNLDTAADYTHRIISNFLSPSQDQPGTSIADLFPFAEDAEYVRDCLKDMEIAFEKKTSQLIDDGINVIFHQVVKPRLRNPLLTEAFRDIEYLIPEDGQQSQPHAAASYIDEDQELASTAAGADDDEDLVKRRFARGWEQLMTPLKRILTEKSYTKLLGTTSNYFGKLLEKKIWAYSGRINELGAIRLERDVAGIVSTVVRGGRYGVRDAFVRCSQICLVVNMDEEEAQEVMQDRDEIGGVEWRIGVEERRRGREMVVRSGR